MAKTNKDVRRLKAEKRLLAKLPCFTTALTMPERRCLLDLERRGVIMYRDEQWHKK